jgi:hypothetical protein
MNKTLESSITSKMITWLNQQPGCRVRKRLAGLTNGGEPDITGTQTFVLRSGFKIGVSIEIESKRPGERPRPLQEKIMNAHVNAGVICFWCDSLDDCMVLYDQFMKKLRKELGV